MPFCGLAQKSRGEFSPRLFSHTQQTARRRSPHRAAPANAPHRGGADLQGKRTRKKLPSADTASHGRQSGCRQRDRHIKERLTAHPFTFHSMAGQSVFPSTDSISILSAAPAAVNILMLNTKISQISGLRVLFEPACKQVGGGAAVIAAAPVVIILLGPL